jgi:hypothetical protein
MSEKPDVDHGCGCGTQFRSRLIQDVATASLLTPTLCGEGLIVTGMLGAVVQVAGLVQ